MSESIIEKRDWVYSAATLDELRNRYDSWANHYEEDLKAPYKQFCFDAATHLTKFLLDTNSLILDIGCGTGMVGEGLCQHGYSNLMGMDISPTMLEAAKTKNVYKHLLAGDIREIDSLYEHEYFDAATCVGVFTYGHVPPIFLQNISHILKTGGFFGLTVIKELFHDNPDFQIIIDQLPWTLVEKKDVIISGETWEDVVLYDFIFRKE